LEPIGGSVAKPFFLNWSFLDWNVLDLRLIHCLLHPTLPFLKVTLVLLRVAAAAAVILLHLGGLVFLAREDEFTAVVVIGSLQKEDKTFVTFCDQVFFFSFASLFSFYQRFCPQEKEVILCRDAACTVFPRRQMCSG